ncbi:hypothetical protein AB0I55_22510 [Actinocatenispora sera]|jgi:hypothetical protein|uniref:Uncharacterized protein n=1 Tax=Actinocatenispora sera TaxID=390989 RepID=A0A810LD14_9ACTN|nr:hypothetical protein [Actinocatenispora sera]BCJ31858.1 hypothetical protein Asera_59660 [Actinocatenispora sera]
MLEKLHDLGLKSSHLYAAGFASIGVSVVSWLVSKKAENTHRADRWGIFVGEWAPTFFAMGNGLRTYEKE